MKRLTSSDDAGIFPSKRLKEQNARQPVRYVLCVLDVEDAISNRLISPSSNSATAEEEGSLPYPPRGPVHENGSSESVRENRLFHYGYPVHELP